MMELISFEEFKDRITGGLTYSDSRVMIGAHPTRFKHEEDTAQVRRTIKHGLSTERPGHFKL